MILQSLTRCYEMLAEKGALEKPGWSKVSVLWALVLNGDGVLDDVMKLENEVAVGKKTKKVPASMRLPARVSRSSGVAANLLCDTSSYVLGVDAKGKPERAKACFADFREKNEALLCGVDHPAARAACAFLRAWNPETAAVHPALGGCLEEICAGGNIALFACGEYLHEIPAVAEACDAAAEEGGEREGICLVTGRRAAIARIHPGITGFPGAQSAGASLVSFNDAAYESYGYDGAQGYNAPVSEYAAFAYTEAIKWLMKSGDHHRLLGETMVLYWAEDGEDAMAQLFGGAMDGVTDEDVKAAIGALAQGQAFRWDDVPLEPSNRFYVLGLAPNAARLSVRFFLADTFGEMVKHLRDHMARLDIVRPQGKELAFWQMLGETVNAHSTDKNKKPSPTLSGDLLRAVLQGLPYPATLYQQVQLRIRAGEEVGWKKAAIIKAYLLKNVVKDDENHPCKEALTVSLNEETNYTPYVLGRLFAVLETLQSSANPGINTTIRDRYFNSACSMPFAVFPALMKLSQAHLKKLPGGGQVHFDRQIQALVGKLPMHYPRRLSLEEQGAFQIGYYHQKQARYQKKEENSDE